MHSEATADRPFAVAAESAPLRSQAPVAAAEQVEDAREAPAITIAELALFAAACGIGIVSLVSLASAHLGHNTLTTVAIGSLVLVGLTIALVYRFERPRVRVDLAGLVPVLVGLGLGAVMMFPGFHYATSDRDPGVYVEHAVAITRTHSIAFGDDLFQARLPGALSAPGGAWPGLWTEPGHPGMIFPQFYHLWPALLATAKDLGGYPALFNTGPLLGVIAVGLAVAAARRMAGWPAAWAAALLLATNELQVWQAKYPTAEIFGQMLFLGAVLGIVLAVRARWRTGAVLAGVLLGLSFLERADGLVLVLIAWVALALLLAARRFDARAAWFAGGLVVLLPYGFYQAYDLARRYTLANNVPSLGKVLAGMVAVALVAGLLAWRGSLVARVVGWGSAPAIRFRLGAAFVGVCAVLLLLGGLRPRLFGADYMLYAGQRIRSYDEQSLIRLSWFFSLPGLALMLVGIGFVAFRRWRLDRWVLALATTGLLTLYAYHLHNSPYLMWATRRFVTSVVPGMVLLMGFGVTAIVVLAHRYLRGRYARLRPVGVVAAAAVVAGLTAFFLSESWPLRAHDENGGALAVEQQLAALSGQQRGIYLWQDAGACCTAPYQLFGGSMLATMNESSALDSARNPGSVLVRYLDYAASSGRPGRPVFYVADGRDAAPAVAGVSSQRVLTLTGRLPHWQETYVSRPKKDVGYPYSLTVYRLRATPAGKPTS